MNKQMLMTMDSLANPKKYTIEQLRDNRDAAAADNAFYAADAAYAFYAADTAYAAAYAASYADNAAATAARATADTAEIWVNKYFARSGENKQSYIDEINKVNK
tara:strand:- start:284 stop:595 length:312 start_codon:yes stop_codon:yes gene_type:complete